MMMPPVYQHDLQQERNTFSSQLISDDDDDSSVLSFDSREAAPAAPAAPPPMVAAGAAGATTTRTEPASSSLNMLGAKPKRMLNCYNLFFQHHKTLIKEQVRSQGRSLEFGELAKTISMRWKNVSAEEKAHFSYLSSLDKERYEREMKQWKNQEDERKERERAGQQELLQLHQPTVPTMEAIQEQVQGQFQAQHQPENHLKPVPQQPQDHVMNHNNSATSKTSMPLVVEESNPHLTDPVNMRRLAHRLGAQETNAVIRMFLR